MFALLERNFVTECFPTNVQRRFFKLIRFRTEQTISEVQKSEKELAFEISYWVKNNKFNLKKRTHTTGDAFF